MRCGIGGIGFVFSRVDRPSRGRLGSSWEIGPSRNWVRFFASRSAFTRPVGFVLGNRPESGLGSFFRELIGVHSAGWVRLGKSAQAGIGFVFSPLSRGARRPDGRRGSRERVKLYLEMGYVGLASFFLRLTAES
jgi:hypothetical protein